jgi:hypothetical protein
MSILNLDRTGGDRSMSDDLIRSIDPLFQEIRQLINTAKPTAKAGAKDNCGFPRRTDCLRTAERIELDAYQNLSV